MVVNPRHEEEPMHGIPMTEEDFERLISVETPYRYELIDGIVYDMTGSTPEHSAISSNIEAILRGQLGVSGPCRIQRDQYVAIPGNTPLAPDVVLTCNIADWDKKQRLKPFRIQSPLIVIEVLSPKTEKYDRTEKFARYQLCPSLEVYMLVSQYEQFVEVYQRINDWRQECFKQAETIKLDTLDLAFPLEEIYEGIFSEEEQK